jgi:hypothetical protein
MVHDVNDKRVTAVETHLLKSTIEASNRENDYEISTHWRPLRLLGTHSLKAAENDYEISRKLTHACFYLLQWIW